MARKTSSDKNLRRKPEPAKAASKGKDSGKDSKAKDLKAKKAKPVAASSSSKPTKPVAAKSGKPVDAKADGKRKDGADKAGGVKAAAAKEAPPKKKRKSGIVRLKAFWGVFNPVMKRVAVFEYAERRQADKKAAELTASAKASHFVQLVKEIIRDEE